VAEQIARLKFPFNENFDLKYFDAINEGESAAIIDIPGRNST